MQKAMITLGAIIAVMSYTGFPRGFKEVFFLLAGAAVMLVGYKMRQKNLRLAYSQVSQGSVEVATAPEVSPSPVVTESADTKEKEEVSFPATSL